MTPREFAIDVVKQLQANGFEALWAGGCVRDQLLGRTPKDYDVATNALPDQVRALFGKKKTIPIGAAFGVITVIGPRSAGQIEVATFRRDAHYSDGRHPDSVQFSDAQEDAKRRDFTINGMFYDPLQDQVWDYVGGQADLQRRIIRAIGDPLARIGEDKLRMLRAIRFASFFGFDLEDATLRAIQAKSSEIDQISAERIGGELVRMLSYGTRDQAARLLVYTELIEHVLPAHWYQQIDWEGAAWEARLKELSRLNSQRFEPAAFLLLRPCFERSFECFFEHVGMPRTKSATGLEPNENPNSAAASKAGAIVLCQLQERWRLKTLQRDNLGWIARHWARLAEGDKLGWSALQPMLIHPAAPLALAAGKAILGETAGLLKCDDCLGWSAEELDPPWLIRGEDLIRLGWKPGPNFKALLQEIRDRQLEGELQTQEQAVRFLETR